MTSRREAILSRRFARRAWMVLLLPVLAVSSCVSHEDKCTRNIECAGQGFCSKAGFCTAECSDDIDCPCGSRCARGCGICLRVDLAGPATCFAYREGLSTEEVIGTCRNELASHGDASADATSHEDGGVCELKPVSLPSCVQSPPLDGGLGNSEASASDVEAGADDTDGSESAVDRSDDEAAADSADTAAETMPEDSSMGADNAGGVGDVESER